MPALQTIGFAFKSRRTLAVALLSFSSGLPLGLVWIAIPDWMTSAGLPIGIVGLITLAQAPWTFKMLWSPMMDRYPLSWLGRRRGWIGLTQILLCAATLLLAGAGVDPDAPWVILSLATAIAFASASQDIAIDAYCVDVLHPEEHGVAVGVRTTVYRVAMLATGALSITLSAWLSWPLVLTLLALAYLLLLVVTRWSPEPRVEAAAPPSLREAVWLPLLGLLARHRALEILAFVVLYKLSDNLSQALLRPFLNEMGYSAIDRGIALGTVGFLATIVGTLAGGMLTTAIGLGHCLWIFGFLQIFSNLGYVLVSQSEVNRPLMYAAMTFEMLTTGAGMGAFGVLLLRITQKRFSATQYALFSSLFALPRILGGPITGFTVQALGWTTFFWLTIPAGLPGLVLLHRFAPLGQRDPALGSRDPGILEPVTPRARPLTSLAAGVLGLLAALSAGAALFALEAATGSSAGFDFPQSAKRLVAPTDVPHVLALLGCVIVGLLAALLAAAVSTSRGQAADAGSQPREPPGGRANLGR